MNKYTFDETTISRLQQAIAVSMNGLPYSTTITAIDATNSLSTFQYVNNLINTQNQEFLAASQPQVDNTSAPVVKKTPVKRTKKQA